MKKIILLLVLWLLVGCVTATTQPTSTTTPPAVDLPTQTSVPTQADPTPWDGHGLTGQLILIQYQDKGGTLLALDLSSGNRRPLFTIPEEGWLAYAAVSPDKKQIAISYAPPPPENTPQLGVTDLYLLPYGAQEPLQPLKTRENAQESYFTPSWMPDSRAIVYSHFFRSDSGDQSTFHYVIEKMDLTGQSQPILQDGLWPVLSPDGTRLAYLSTDAGNELYVANADGSQAVRMTSQGGVQPVDAHLFSPDGQYVYYSMVNPQASARSWWEILFGIQVVSAHETPADWYRMPVSGGDAQRLTNLNESGLVGAFSPDGRALAFISESGLYVLDTSTLEVIQLSKEPFLGSIDWLE